MDTQTTQLQNTTEIQMDSNQIESTNLRESTNRVSHYPETRHYKLKTEKSSIFTLVKNFFKKRSTKITNLRRDSKWRKIRKGTGDGIQKIDNFKEKVENKQIFNEIDDSVDEITINKTELIWLLDNIHSNTQIIKKLQRRQSQFEDALDEETDSDSYNSQKSNKKCNKLKVKQIMDRLQSQVEELESEKLEITENLKSTSQRLISSENEITKKNEKIDGLKLDLELMQQAFDASESDFYIMAKTYQKQLQHAI